MFIALYRTRDMQSAIDQLLPTPAYQRKAHRTNESVRNSHLVLIACLQTKIDTGEN